MFPSICVGTSVWGWAEEVPCLNCMIDIDEWSLACEEREALWKTNWRSRLKSCAMRCTSFGGYINNRKSCLFGFFFGRKNGSFPPGDVGYVVKICPSGSDQAATTKNRVLKGPSWYKKIQTHATVFLHLRRENKPMIGGVCWSLNMVGKPARTRISSKRQPWTLSWCSIIDVKVGTIHINYTQNFSSRPVHNLISFSSAFVLFRWKKWIGRSW